MIQFGTADGTFRAFCPSAPFRSLKEADKLFFADSDARTAIVLKVSAFDQGIDRRQRVVQTFRHRFGLHKVRRVFEARQ